MLDKTIKKATMADLTSDNPALLQEITANVTAALTDVHGKVVNEMTVKIDELKTQIATYQRNDAIRTAAAKQNQVALGEELITAGVTEIEAYKKLIEAGIGKTEKVDTGVFQATASEPVGSTASKTPVEGPQTQEEAIKAVMAANPKLTRGAAIQKARRDNVMLFMGHIFNTEEK